MREREERLRQQLERGMREERDDCLKKQLTTVIESWQTEAQRWRKHQSELEEKLHEQETLRKQQEEERKQETERFQENFQQLWNYIEKKEKKKKKKGVWSRILKFWKK
ncbi:golgin subfamily A member 6-like protein 1 [Takifugu flavidus]|nr:golgin subfamily A member 6-like protein 1 [Takifugu flavidus]